MPRPGEALAARPLQFIFLADCSGSMNINGKIQALNHAIRESIPHMQQSAGENPHAEVQVRALKFSSGASWHLGQPTPVKDFKWVDLTADGVTDMGRALKMVAAELKMDRMPERGLPPVLVLATDGQPTDNFDEGLQALLNEPWGKRAVRIGIAIGEDADQEVLKQFVANSEIPVLSANNPDQLINYIRWVSTQVVKAASAPPSKPDGDRSSGNVVVPPAPDPTNVGGVW